MSKPPKIVIPGLNRGIGVPPGYVLGRMPGTGKGPAQLLNLGSLRKLGVAGASGVAQSTSTAISTAHSENVSLKTSVSTSLSQISGSLSGAISSTTSLSTGVSTVISGSISAVNSRVDSLSTAVGGGGGVDDDSALSTSLSSAVSVNITQSTSLSQISSSLSGAVSSTGSLSTAVSTVISGSISAANSRIDSLSGVTFDKARAYLNTAGTTSSGSWVKVPLDTVDYDTNSIWVAGSTRFTPKRSGYYQCNARVRTGTTGQMTTSIAKNGTIHHALGDDGTAVTASSGATLILCNGTTDYIELYYFANSARSWTTGSFDTYLEVLGPF